MVDELLREELLDHFVSLKKEYKLANVERKIEFFKPYDWQMEFANATSDSKQCTLLCANRVGKTFTACSVLSYFLTGQYPKWWKGKRFDHPIDAIACGVSGESIRDVLQKELIGTADLKNRKFDGSGLIPLNNLDSFIASPILRNAIREIKIRWKDTELFSTLKFRSYEQGPSVLGGQVFDIVLIDEEPLHDGLRFYGECLARTATADNGNGGIVLLSFTPESGLTDLVDLIWNNPSPGQFVLNVGWDQAPHISASVKAQLLAAIPAHLLEAKTKGIPSFGSELIYKMDNEAVIQAFEIPDYFRVLAAIDFGIGHPAACVFVAIDDDKDIIYVYHSWSKADEMPSQHAHRTNSVAPKIRVVYPHDANSREKGSGKLLKDYYIEAGINMFRQFCNPDNSNYVEPGILEIQQRLNSQRLFIFNNNRELISQLKVYRRNPKTGLPLKKNDDLIDALRYAVIMAKRFGQRKADVGKVDNIDKYYPDLRY